MFFAEDFLQPYERDKKMINIDNDYEDFIINIRSKWGIDLNLYKETQMKRRLTTLRNKRGYSNFQSYYEALTRDIELLEEFKDRITINVTEFFRNPERWKVLKDVFIPALTKDNKNLSIWSAACSTGEEPYSLAILMQEYFPSVDFEITATDIDHNVLATAKQGHYSKNTLNEVSDYLKKRYFSKTGDSYSVHPSLKRNITFKHHNLLTNSYPSGFDLIVCRNVLIYFTEEAKKEIYLNFSNSLKEDGILFVGSTEQIFNPAKYNLDLAETFFYRKK